MRGRKQKHNTGFKRKTYITHNETKVKLNRREDNGYVRRPNCGRNNFRVGAYRLIIIKWRYGPSNCGS